MSDVAKSLICNRLSDKVKVIWRVSDVELYGTLRYQMLTDETLQIINEEGATLHVRLKKRMLDYLSLWAKIKSRSVSRKAKNGCYL